MVTGGDTRYSGTGAMESVRTRMQRVLEDFGTAQVLNNPTEDDQKQALEAAEILNQVQIVRDTALVVAKRYAEFLFTLNLRPADYAMLPDLPKVLAGKLSEALKGELSQFFDEVVRSALKVEG